MAASDYLSSKALTRKVLSMHRNGASVNQIVEKLGTYARRVKRILQDQGEHIRDGRKPQISESERTEILELFGEGFCQAEIARQYSLSVTRIRAILSEAGAYSPPRSLTKEDEEEIVRSYRGGATLKTLRLRYGVGVQSVKSLLVANGVEIDVLGRRSVRLTEDEEKQIAEFYAGGGSLEDAGRLFCTGVSAARKVIAKHGIEIRRSADTNTSRARERLEDLVKQNAAMIEDYRGGRSVVDLAAKYGTYEMKIRSILTAAGVRLRGRKEQIDLDRQRRGDIKAFDGDEIERLYVEDLKSVYVIARIMGVHTSKISAELHSRGIQRTPAATAKARTKKSDENILSLGEKQCVSCSKVMPLTEFYMKDKVTKRYDSWCCSCRNEYAKVRAYGITGKERKEIIKAQGGVCAICKKKPAGHWVTDHCHKSGPVRGMLCSACNMNLGGEWDSVEVLRNAVEYLEHNPAAPILAKRKPLRIGVGRHKVVH